MGRQVLVLSHLHFFVVRLNVAKRVNTDRNRLQTIFDRLVALLPATPPVRSESSSAPLNIVGFRIQTSGRQSGQEMAETQTYRHSAVPTSRLDANIDYGTATLETRFGVVGAKVWIHFQQTGRMINKDQLQETQMEEVEEEDDQIEMK